MGQLTAWENVLKVGVALGLGTASGIYLWNRFYIRRRIGVMVQASKDLARGQPTRISGIHAPGELGQLARALDDLSRNLHNQLAEIQKETAHLDSILNNMAEGVIALDAEGRLSSINPAAQALLNLDPEFSKGRPLLEAIRNGTLADLVRFVFHTGNSRYQEISFFLPQERAFQVHAGPLKMNGATQGALLVLHDITEIKRLERVRRDFVANVSHELRTPLASIEGFTETLLEGALNDPAHNREFVETIHTHAQRLSRLIDDLLDLSAIESGLRPPAKQLVKLSNQVEDTAKTLGPVAQSRHVQVTLKIPPALTVQADPDQLRQVLLNLLDNAIKFNKEGGKVEASARASGNQIIIEVKDTGIGIPLADLPRIFERFYRVDKARSRELGGTGLGLSIVKHIAEAHNGSVTAESDEGQGSTFRIVLPTT